MYKNKHDKRNAAEIGNKAERVFVALAVQNGYNVKNSTVEQNSKNRIDYFLEKNGSTKGFDVKARKKICAYDRSYSDTWTWVEFKTANGFHGWLYGDCDYIAFEKKDYFLIVDRISLKNLCEKIVDRKKEFVKTCNEAKYRVYQRRDQEQIALIKTSDIKKLNRKTIWKKN